MRSGCEPSNRKRPQSHPPVPCAQIRRAACRRPAPPRTSPGARDQRGHRPRQLAHAIDPRDRHGEDRAHRRAYGLGAERVGASRAQRDTRGAERQRPAEDRPDIARVTDAPQRHAQRACGHVGPALLIDADRAGARAEARDLPEDLGIDLGPGHPLPAATKTSTAGQPAVSAAATRSSPSATKRVLRSRTSRRVSLRSSLSFVLWWLVIMALAERKRAPS